MQQINIVISGFTPYEASTSIRPCSCRRRYQAMADPAQSQAISEELLQDIAVTVTNVTLPVSFAKAWPTLLEAIEQAKPDIVIATGLKRTSRGILLERCATNLMDAAKPDADNVIPPRRPIDPEGPAAYWTRLPLRSILHDFAKHEIPAALSSDAVRSYAIRCSTICSTGRRARNVAFCRGSSACRSSTVGRTNVDCRSNSRPLRSMTCCVNRYDTSCNPRQATFCLAEDGSAFYGTIFCDM